MSVFNTHGGYFAPKGLMRIDSGGSHEENPNGGVQIGVDEQGVPNLVEENEVIYDDYVYSDNIKADGSILKKMNLPEKYSGKLYSEIADAFCDEADERPNDPISNNGLRVMLTRLADAQEEQKARTERRRFKKATGGLSPEEFLELQSMMAPTSQVPEPNGTEVPLTMPDVQQEQPVQAPLMQKYGGPLNKFWPGGPMNVPGQGPAGARGAAPAYKWPVVSGGFPAYEWDPDSFKTGFQGLYYPTVKRGSGLAFTDAPQGTPKAEVVAQPVSAAARPSVPVPEIPLTDEGVANSVLYPDPSGVNLSVTGTAVADALKDSMNNFRIPAPAGKPSGSLFDTSGTRTVKLPDNPGNNEQGGVPDYTTVPRYAGAALSGLLALDALSKSPDRYRFTPVVPSRVEGEMPVQLQRYNPLDVNLTLNAIRAQGNAAARAISNSGMGPSAGAALLANNANTTNALGTGLLQAWQANNQQRNQVIAANNAALAQQAQFNMQRNMANAQAENMARNYNAQMALRTAAMNNQAQQDKYNAVGANLNNLAEALSGIGQENFAMNQINNNPALLQYLFPGGRTAFKGSRKSKKNGGKQTKD